MPSWLLPKACPGHHPTLHPLPGFTFLEASTPRLVPAGTRPMAAPSPGASLRAEEDPVVT